MANINTPQDLATLMVGLHWNDAKDLTYNSPYVYRIGKIDDMTYFLTQDVDPNRITIEIENNIVTKATVG